MKTLKSTDCRRRHGGKLAVAMATAVVIGISAWAPTAVAEPFGQQMTDWFKKGDFDVNFRYRYEFADQDNSKRDANASTLRTRLVFRTAKWNDLDITVNMDDVHTIVANNYNSTRNGKTQYQTVPDPTGVNLNIAAFTYSGLTNTTLVAGRQRITRGDHRFIGNVGWRQNEQTYDAFSVNYKAERFTANYAYITRVNRIFGPDAPPAGTPPGASIVTDNAWSSESSLVNAAYKLHDALSVSGYAYLLDFSNAAPFSSQTLGLRLSGAPEIGNWAITYAAEYASQEDYKDNPAKYENDYILGQLGFKWKRLDIKASYEVLGSDQSATVGGNPVAGGIGFLTPLATLHAHNGWADKFLATPGVGLQDASIAFSGKVAKRGKLALILHDFSSDAGSTNFGTELDFLVKWALGKHYSVLGKFAYYDADTNANNPATGSLGQDTMRAWAQLMAAF